MARNKVSGYLTDGHEKWIDFSGKFWNRECVCWYSEKAFANQYRKWCAKVGSRFSAEKTVSIYAHASSQVNTLPMTDTIKCLVTHAAAQLNTIKETIFAIQHESEIGGMRRFDRKQSLVAFAGVDTPPCQSGTFVSKNSHISKRGSPRLRKTLSQIMSSFSNHV